MKDSERKAKSIKKACFEGENLRHFRDKVFMKVAKCKIHGEDGYVCSYKRDGKYCRKYFYSKKDAEAFKRNLENVSTPSAKIVNLFSTAQMDDIVAAVRLLPKGRTLVEAVKKAWQYDSNADVEGLINSFMDIKRAKGLSVSHIKHTRARLLDFQKNFKSFSYATPAAILEYIKSKGKQKTIIHYKSTLSDFFAYCFRKDAILSNPFDKLSSDDFLIEEQKFEIGFLSVEQAKSFMALLEQKYPQYCKFYALALFAGVRVDECQRFKNDFIDYGGRSITFPKEIVKGGKKAWIVRDYEPNLWAWLEKYRESDFKRPSNTLRTKIGKDLNLPQNFARHSFATYHLSLYKDAERTRFITRHNNTQTLQNHYFGALVDKQTAKAYFEILPS